METQISHSLSAELNANHSPLVRSLSSPYLHCYAADPPRCLSHSNHIVHGSDLASFVSRLIWIPCTASCVSVPNRALGSTLTPRLADGSGRKLSWIFENKLKHSLSLSTARLLVLVRVVIEPSTTVTLTEERERTFSSCCLQREMFYAHIDLPLQSSNLSTVVIVFHLFTAQSVFLFKYKFNSPVCLTSERHVDLQWPV